MKIVCDVEEQEQELHLLFLAKANRPHDHVHTRRTATGGTVAHDNRRHLDAMPYFPFETLTSDTSMVS